MKQSFIEIIQCLEKIETFENTISRNLENIERISIKNKNSKLEQNLKKDLKSILSSSQNLKISFFSDKKNLNTYKTIKIEPDLYLSIFLAIKIDYVEDFVKHVYFFEYEDNIEKSIEDNIFSYYLTQYKILERLKIQASQYHLAQQLTSTTLQIMKL